MQVIWENVRQSINRLKTNRKPKQPLSPGWKWAAIIMIIPSLILFIIQSIYFFGDRGIYEFTVATLLFILFISLISGLLTVLLFAFKKLPNLYLWLFFSSCFMLFICFMGPLEVSALFIFVFILSLTLWGALIYRLKEKGGIRNKLLFALLTIWIGLFSYWIINDGQPSPRGVTLKELKKANHYDSSSIQNPNQNGLYKVQSITYGSKNSYRKEFNRKNSLLTKPIDASSFLEKWSTLRTKTFGFGPKELPLNGTVWYPKGEGPFPLVIAVHGNHLMTDYSDPGYKYLGQLLASRGYIFVSIDENFLNVSPFNDMFIFHALEKENPARAILLLEHLKTWKNWNKEEKNPFFEKVDMDNIALIGHSRGGEAISIAAAFNQLSNSPDNAKIKFNYGFHIRSLISISGTDGYYSPSGKPVPLQNINYLALHGSHDMDVNSFSGYSQFNRIHFNSDQDFMKASVYIYGANHGQFNQTWGKRDGVGLGNQLFNLKQLMPIEDQERVAKVFISSFLDATIKNKKEYKLIFKDIGYAQKWLPNTMYISDYGDSKTSILTSFDEDIDVLSTSVMGGRIQGKHLMEWKEERMKLKYGESLNSVVRLGWNLRKLRKAASYTVFLPGKGLNLTENSSISFSMADSTKRKNPSYRKDLIDLTITLVDDEGNRASLPLSHVSKLIPMIEGKLLKWPFTELSPTKEPIFQHFNFQLKDFKRMNPAFNPQTLNQISFEFNRTEKGTVLVNDIGIR
ncbi:MFS transporter [Peribacillus sp. NPDC096448]|uniref:MFS transporter n=1 Tax=Peribacillus sp. NPDC096448 TaxID=3364395 RepID=UPI003826709F